MEKLELQKAGRVNGASGFTLVEVMLYLAIVGLVIMIGFNAVGGRTAQVQFTDSMRGLHGYVNSQYNEFINGVMPADLTCSYSDDNNRTPEIYSTEDAQPDGTCVLLGKAFVFTDAEDGDSRIVDTYNLVGRNLISATEDDNCGADDLRCLDPYVIDLNDPRVYELLWGTEFIKGNERNHTVFGNGGNPIEDAEVNGTTDNVRGFGWLKLPTTNQVVPLVFGTNPAFGKFTAEDFGPDIYVAHETVLQEEGSVPKVALNTEFNSAFCFQGSNGQYAMLVFGEGESQEVVNLTFGEETSTHDCRPSNE